MRGERSESSTGKPSRFRIKSQMEMKKTKISSAESENRKLSGKGGMAKRKGLPSYYGLCQNKIAKEEKHSVGRGASAGA